MSPDRTTRMFRIPDPEAARRRRPAWAAFMTTLIAIAAGSISTAVVQAAPPSGTISTFAGGVGGPAAGPSVALHPVSVAASGGSLYVGDSAGEAVRVISPTTGGLTTLAGVGIAASPPDAAVTASASLSGPMGTTVDAHGNVLIAEPGYTSGCGGCGQVIRVAAAATGTFYGRSMVAGHLYVIAGQPDHGGSGGDGGPASSASLFDPGSVAVDAAGDVAIVDFGNDSIRFISGVTDAHRFLQNMTKGHIYTLAGNGVRSYYGDGGYAWNALMNLDSNSAITFDAAGNIVFADTQNDVIRVIAASTGTFYGISMAKGFIYHVAGNGINGHVGDGGLATSAELFDPVGVALDAAGNIVIGDAGNNLVRVVAVKTATYYGRAMVANHIYTIAGTWSFNGSYSGDGGPATAAHLWYPAGVAVDAAGNVAIADETNNRVRVVAAKTGSAYGRAVTAGHVYTVAGNGSDSYSGDGAAATAAQMDDLTGAFVDPNGNLIVADGWNERLRIIPSKTGTWYGRALVAGRGYTLAGTGTDGFSGDKGPASAAMIGLVNHYNGVGPWIDYATGITADKAGNLLFADTDNHRVRVVAAKTGTYYGQAMTTGRIYTIAGSGTYGYSGDGGLATHAAIRSPDGVAVDSAGNVLVTDVDGSSNAVRVVAGKTGTYYGQAMKAGRMYTLIGAHCTGGAIGDGGLASHACLYWPTSMVVDATGNLLINEGGHVRLIPVKAGTYYGHAIAALHITTIYTAPASALLNAISLDRSGNVLLVGDRVRVFAAKTGTFYHQVMTAGHVYAIAGTGSRGVTGDGGPATSAALSPAAVAVDSLGDLFIADSYAGRVRRVQH